MFTNVIKVALRRFSHYKVYTLINVLGLATGLCSCLVIWLIVQFEFSFDRFQADGNRIYQINTLSRYSADEPLTTIPAVLPPLADQVQHTVPGIETIASYHILFDAKATIDNDDRRSVSFPSTPVFTGGEYFGIMNYKWVEGSPASSLEEPFTVVLTLKKAQAYFGSIPTKKMIGKSVLYNDSIRVRVTGIIMDWSANTDFPYDEFISMPTVKQPYLVQALQLEHWKGLSGSSRILLKLNKQGNAAVVNNTICSLFKKNWADQYLREVSLQPLADVHFTDYGGGWKSQMSRLPVLYALICIALFILALAIINYVNLTTAQAISRDKETGIRKILGGSKTSLFMQFLCETFLITLAASMVAALFVQPVLSFFRDFIPAQIEFDPFTPSVLLFLTGVIAITSLVAGIYPAKIQSSGRLISNLKSDDLKGSNKFILRKSLIVFQFTVSLIFITCTLMINRQINFMTGKANGLTTDAIILLPSNSSSDLNTSKLLEQRISRLTGIRAVARENMPPMGADHGFFSVKYVPKSDESILIAAIKADEHFIPLYNIKLLAGRNLSPSDTLKEFVINETYSKLLGFKTPADALGKMLYTWNKNCPIVGVVEDFHQFSFHEAIKPQVITSLSCTDIAVKLNTSGRSASESKTLIAAVEKQWKAVYPHEPFEFEFLDESIAALYKKELSTSWLMQTATLMTIFISCFGLVGLSMFTAEKRAKEIGIRKVLGAGVCNIVAMLIGEFLLLVTVAFMIAVPFALLFMHNWLQDFAYRTNMSWVIFVGAGLIAIIILFLGVGWQALKAARMNPVKSLQSG